LHIEWYRQREGDLFVELSSQDALSRQLAAGDMVTVFNDQGRVTARCRISQRVRQGVAWMAFGGFGDASGEACSVNVLTPEEPTDWGGGSGFYDAFVDVERIQS
jgi:anaerobic selenocysteine-containing dehydrogenase